MPHRQHGFADASLTRRCAEIRQKGPDLMLWSGPIEIFEME